ncbi:FATTY ACID EXPORT 3, chloroplastic [Olea europaea subsp. europaea]|uniref:FATTY ACID EXPORT 3, chloroplastic n=1 Tax=Olea europaea subsp. europaea TaxID=158383 RepID=A0A8S0STQ0_OLEEU|nr:FATTY ACID EXPORT 3, chloroplastic [Olea europaea subsp. europaea]
MSIRIDSITIQNPGLKRAYSPPTMALCFSPHSSLGFEALHRPDNYYKMSIVARFVQPRGLGLNLVPLRGRNFRERSVLSLAASQEESPSGIEIEKEEDLKAGADESEEAWKQTLDSFKEQALKMQGISKEAYEVYSEKAIVILKETSEKSKILADKARDELSKIAKEVAEESKTYLATAAENSPEQVKDIVETFAYPVDELNDVSKVRDFYVGIPYGALLCAGGFLSFMLTGSVSAIRFGIILGGTLLAISISSLRSWNKGELLPLALKGQTAIATILFLRNLRIWSMRPFIANFVTTIISGAVAAFFVYRIVRDGGDTKGGSSLEASPEN